MKDLWRVLKESVTRWSDDRCYRLGAALSYYAVFSIFPLILLAVTAVGFAMGHDAGMRDRLLDYVSRSGAPELRPLLDQTLTSMQTHSTARGVGALVGLVSTIVGASGVFSELQSDLDTVWRVDAPKSPSIWQTLLVAVRDKALSFVVVLGAALVLLITLLVSTALSAIDSAASRVVESPVLWLIVEAASSLAILTGLFTAMYKMIPRAAVAWRDALPGGLLAALVFTGLKRILAFYLGHLGNYAAYGAVGGMLGLLAWIYLASLIVLLGAELSRVYAEQLGSLAGDRGSAAREEEARRVAQGRDGPGAGAKPHPLA